MRLSAAAVLFFALAAPAAAAGGPYYFTAVRSGAYRHKDPSEMEKSYKVLREMVRLAGEKNVRLTLLFSAQYAEFISSDPSRLTALKNWKDDGHEIGVYHQGPDTGDWDGYSDLSAKELARVRRDGGTGSVPPGHSDYFKALSRLEPVIKTSCMSDKRDLEFQQAGPPYEICQNRSGGGAGYSGVNGAILLSGETPPRKHLSVFHPTDKQATGSARKAFSGMKDGVYGTVFDSTEADFGPFYAWLAFLDKSDPGCARSRTVNTVINGDILEEKKTAKKRSPSRKKAKKAKPIEKTQEITAPVFEAEKPAKQEIPRLKPVPSFFGNPLKLQYGRNRTIISPLGRGYCGDGLCDRIERARKGACPSDCGR